jgi:amidase
MTETFEGRANEESSSSASGSECDFGSIAHLSDAMRARKISASELLENTIARIEALDRRINAVVVRDFDRAREAAKAADMALARGEQRALLGIPVTLKEPFNVAGLEHEITRPAYGAIARTDRPTIAGRVKLRRVHAPVEANVPTKGEFFVHVAEILADLFPMRDRARRPSCLS